MRSCAGIASLAVVMFLGGFSLNAKEPAPVAPHDRLLVLPVEFAYFSYGPGRTLKRLVDRSEQAQRNLEASLQRALKRDESGSFVALPELSAGEQATLEEYTGLLRLVADTENTGIIEEGWRSSGSSIGSGLAFLAERAGVERMIFVSGGRADPQGGLALMSSTDLTTYAFPGPAGNRRVLSAMVVDLRSGNVLQNLLPYRGFDGEPDTVAGANTWMRALLEIVPQQVRREMLRIGNPRAEKPLRHPRPREGYVLTLSTGWLEAAALHMQCFHRSLWRLESICIDHEWLNDALRAEKVPPDADAMKVGEIAVRVLKKDPRHTDMEVTSMTPARVAGRDGFRIELVSRLILADATVRQRHLVYGVAGPSGACLVRFDAPAIYFFDRHLAEFEAMMPTFKMMPRSRTEKKYKSRAAETTSRSN